MANTEEVHEHCHKYYWGSSSRNDKIFVQMNWTMYEEWLENRRIGWLRWRQYTSLVFYCNMDDERTKHNFLFDAGCPLYKISHQPIAILMDYDSDEHIDGAIPQNNQLIVPPSPERSNNFIHHNPVFQHQCDRYWQFNEKSDYGGNLASLAQDRVAVRANYPAFLKWMEERREEYLLDKGFRDMTWYRTLHENLKCSLFDNYSGCVWGDNKYYFSDYNTTAVYSYMSIPLICKGRPDL